jgi:hypothetical protein
VYVDESGIRQPLQRDYARAPRGELVAAAKPGKRFEQINIIGARCGDRHLAIDCYWHKTNSAYFEWWFAHCLLAEVPKGHTVIMDNASFHRKKILRKLARGKVRLLFLPAYSPDYNPIEKSWANMKRFLRNNGQDYQSLASAVLDYFNVPDI